MHFHNAGWIISTLSTVQSAFLAAALVFVGVLLYHETITASKLLGVAICMVGIYFINK